MFPRLLYISCYFFSRKLHPINLRLRLDFSGSSGIRLTNESSSLTLLTIGLAFNLKSYLLICFATFETYRSMLQMHSSSVRARMILITLKCRI